MYFHFLLVFGAMSLTFEIIKVKNLRKYDNKLFIKALKIVGFEKIKKMDRGLDYDTSEKLYMTKNKKIYGNGDLRYLVTKSKKRKENKKSIKLYLYAL